MVDITWIVPLLVLCLSPSLVVATSLSFNGTQYIHVTLPEPKESQTEDVSLRFKTQTPNGLLFVTYQKGNRDRMELYLQKGKLRYFIHIGNEKKTKMVPKTIKKNEWYSVKLKRRGKLITLILNNSTSVEVQLNGATDVLKFGGILIGGRPPGHLSHGRSKVGFYGHMQKFFFNGQHYFEMARDTNDKNIEVFATFDQKDKLVDHPLTIKSSVAYLTTKFKPYSTFTLYFQFKTTQPNGLILYSNGGGEGKDFMAVELVEGKVHYTFDTGGGVRTVRSQATLLNNNLWHEVAIVRPTLAKHILRVDSQVTVDEMPGKRVVHFDVDDQFFIGGVPADLWNTIHSQIQSREGYQGCLASFYLDEVTKNFMEGQGHIEEQFKDAIIEGCEGPSADCQQNHCQNHGVCVQEWNLVRCDCDMTSYTGDYCQTESAAYTFRGDGGLIKFTYREENRRDTEVDRLAFGFMTEEKDCVLARIESGNSNDYIEMELLDGNLFLVYNMGSMNHPIGLFTTVSDGKYHIVNFVRHGPNATLSLLDSGQAQPKHPEGHQLSIFNNVARVYIGGKEKGEKIQKPFRGTIIGLVLNRVRISELASANDNRVHVKGDVQLEPRPVLPARTTVGPSVSPSQSSSYHSATPASKMMSTMGSKGSGKGDVTDDLIASGSTLDCSPDDCYDVTTITDGIITPKLKLITTPRPSTTPSTTPAGGDSGIPDGSGREPCDDEEECASGSGAGELPPNKDEFTFPTSPKGGQPKGSTDFPHNKGARENVTNADIISTYNMTSSTPKALTRSTIGLHTSVTEPRYNDRHAGSTQIPGVTGNSASIWSGFNLYVFLGIAGGVAIVLVILAYAFYKYKSKDEGTYKIDESKNYDAYEERKPMTQANGGYNKSGPLIGKPVKKKSVKEWYV